MIYPKKLNSKKGEIILNIFIVVSIILAVTLVLINKITTPEIGWAGLANCGIIYIWITVIYCIRRNTNIGGHVLLQMIATSIAILYIDNRLGYRGWSINIAIPIIIMVANVTMLILTIISYKKYVEYAIYQLIIVVISLLPFVLMTIRNIGLGTLGRISIEISILNLIITLVLCYKDVKEAILMKIHM